jgi:hypothetical protein
MAAKDDDLRERITAFAFPRGGVEVVRANRGYTLYSQRTGGQMPACARPARAARFKFCGGATSPGQLPAISAPLSSR